MRKNYDLNNDFHRTEIIDAINSLEHGKWKIKIKPVKPTRNEIQNNLYFHWIGQTHKQRDEQDSRDWLHGFNKLHILLPILITAEDQAWRERGLYHRDILDNLEQYQHKIFYAFQAIRSKNLPPKLYAVFLDALYHHWLEKGVVLSTKKDEYFEAIGYTLTEKPLVKEA